MAAVITVIPPTRNPLTHQPKQSTRKRRVAAYARVSTDSEEQKTSYEAQVDYYTRYIQSRSDWEFVEVFTDDGISAVMTKKRDGFNRMIDEALSGKIDLIVTKSVSRFARNTVDSLVTIRHLKEKGVEVFFEKENIYTLDSKGELLLTIMSSLAQEESRSISENVTWGQRKRFADGKVSMPYKRFLGYQKGIDGTPVIVEEEAKVVRLIYRLFLSGKTPSGIGKELEARGILSPGNKTKWSKTTIESILTNEKYKGDALLQKKFTVDFLQKKLKRNEGEVQQYYVEGSHPPIIPSEEWERVQIEMERRKKIGRSYSGNTVLSSRLFCGSCGGRYVRKVWHSTDRYRKAIWRCGCQNDMPPMDEELIKSLFIRAYNTLVQNSGQTIQDCKAVAEMLSDFSDINKSIQTWQEELYVIEKAAKTLVQENATESQPQSIYLEKYEHLTKRHKEALTYLDSLNQELKERQNRLQRVEDFIESLQKSTCYMEAWEDSIWSATAEKGIIHRDRSITFVFCNGAEMEVKP